MIMNRAVHAYPFDEEDDPGAAGDFMDRSIAGRYFVEGSIGGATLRLQRKNWREISVEVEGEWPMPERELCQRVVFLAVRNAPGDWYHAVQLLRQSHRERQPDDTWGSEWSSALGATVWDAETQRGFDVHVARFSGQDDFATSDGPVAEAFRDDPALDSPAEQHLREARRELFAEKQIWKRPAEITALRATVQHWKTVVKEERESAATRAAQNVGLGESHDA